MSFAACCAFLALLIGPFKGRIEHAHFREYGTYWASGNAARHGLNPFAAYPLTWRFNAFSPDGPETFDVNLNPPAVLPLFSLLSRFDVYQGGLFCLTLSIAMFCLSCGVLVWRFKPAAHQVFWMMTGGAILSTLNVLQNYALLFVLAAAAWMLLDSENDVAAGLFLGALCAFKPNFCLWPVLLALRGGKRAVVLSTSATFIVLSAAPIPLFGRSVYPEWLSAVQSNPHFIFPQNVSFIANAVRFGLGQTGYALAAVTIAATCWLARNRKLTLQQISGLAICAAILCSPISWMEYVLVVVPLLLSRPWTPRQHIALWLLWIHPYFLDPSNACASNRDFALGGLPYLAGFILLLTSFADPISLPGHERRTHAGADGRDRESEIVESRGSEEAG